MLISEFMYQAGWFRLEEKKHAKQYLFHGLNVNFCGNYVQVVGEIPYLLAKEIYEFDPKGKLEILASVADCIDPEKVATNLELDEYMKDYAFDVILGSANIDELKRDTEVKRQKLIKEKPESMYIELYTINSVNGLRVFLEKATNFFEKCN